MINREEFLNIPKLSKEIAEEENRIAVIRAKLYSPRGLDTNEKVQSSGSQTALADVVIDMEQRLEAKKIELSSLRAEALRMIYGADLEDSERLVLMLRYVEDSTWLEITEAIHYSVATVFRIHRAAIDKLFCGAKFVEEG